jgi:hypothetical protein
MMDTALGQEASGGGLSDHGERLLQLHFIGRETIMELCGGRILYQVFDRLLPGEPGPGKRPLEGVETVESSQSMREEGLLAVCRLCSRILGESDDSIDLRPMSTHGGAHVTRVLSVLAFHSTGDPFVGRLWNYLREQSFMRQGPGEGALSTARYLRHRSALHLFYSVFRYQPRSRELRYRNVSDLYETRSYQLMALDDEEFYSRPVSLPLGRVLEVVEATKQLLYFLYWTQPTGDKAPSGGAPEDLQVATLAGSCPILTAGQRVDLSPFEQVMRSGTRLFNQLYQRHTRRHFPAAPESLWLWPVISLREVDQEADHEDEPAGPSSMEAIFDRTGRAYAVLTKIPQVGGAGANRRGGEDDESDILYGVRSCHFHSA